MPYEKSKDPWAGTAASISEQPRKAFAITPDNTNDLPIYPKAIWVGTAGNLSVIPLEQEGDAPVTFTNVPIGWFEVRVRRVFAAGTAASGLIGVH